MRHALALALVLAACGDSSPDPDLTTERKIPAALAADVHAVAQANNQFALDALAVLPAEGNQFFSPFSISTALWMLDAGAAGDTDAELRAALHASLPGDAAHHAYGAMLDSLEVGRSFELYTLATANRLFGQKGAPFLQPFLDLTANAYGAPLESLDFRSDPEAARGVINDWVADRTDDKIPELLEAGSVGNDARLVLANAIVFKGKWVHQFDPARTAPGKFTLASSAQVDTPMMSKKDDVARVELPGGYLGVLPFRGKDLSMMVLVPDEANGLPALEEGLTAASLATAIATAEQHVASGKEMTVILPKFKFETELDLREVLPRLGIVSAFDERADLSGIDGTRDLVVQKAVHKAVIAVDEQGAEAAAATGVVVGPTSLPPQFVVDRPFVFFIYDHVTGSILFLGRVNDPR
ncbi:MAG: serpin family protein [Deltaproteobacteria bacterium]|nr:serpin family protein [Deltaproteobacteria bacterium]MCW5803182.1 serpin family protein [Deltaproteobacteria bacterium]